MYVRLSIVTNKLFFFLVSRCIYQAIQVRIHQHQVKHRILLNKIMVGALKNSSNKLDR